jgi:hypothetical protein
MLTEWRADKARIDRARHAAGYTALHERAVAIEARADALLDRIDEAQPCTVEGAIALIEASAVAHDACIMNALAGLRAIAAGGMA